MAKQGKGSKIHVSVEPELKEQAEQILDRLGISMSDAMSMFLRQVVLHRGIPFEVKLPREEPIAYEGLTKEQFDAMIEKGMEDIREGRYRPAAEVFAEIRRDYGL